MIATLCKLCKEVVMQHLIFFLLILTLDQLSQVFCTESSRLSRLVSAKLLLQSKEGSLFFFPLEAVI